jgi:hypothetical protein
LIEWLRETVRMRVPGKISQVGQESKQEDTAFAVQGIVSRDIGWFLWANRDWANHA